MTLFFNLVGKMSFFVSNIVFNLILSIRTMTISKDKVELANKGSMTLFLNFVGKMCFFVSNIVFHLILNERVQFPMKQLPETVTQTEISPLQFSPT